jgi:hypothetical protein
MHVKPRKFLLPGLVAVVALLGSTVIPAAADPATCQKTIVRKLLVVKKKHLTQHVKCIDRQNKGLLSGPCPDLSTAAKIAKAKVLARDSIADACTMGDLAALGFASDCQLESGVSGAEATCAALPVTTPAELADCLSCWKSAELSEYIATLFASHALEVCGGDLSETSPVCSDLDCTTPLPDQRDLGDTGENDCQRDIGKAGIKYLINREKLLEKCALAGGTQSSCLADPEVLEKLATLTLKKDTRIQRCGNRDPVASPPFCCKTTGNMCVAAADREDCEVNLGGQAQEDKICNAGSCDPIMGAKSITWWEFCPESNSCPGTPLSSLNDLKDCVGTAGDAIADELLCWQFPGNGGADWPCPPPDGSPSGAFLDGSYASF